MAYYATRHNQRIQPDSLGAPSPDGLGQACPPCSIWTGAACIPCPEGADLPECRGCEAGEPILREVSFWERSGFWSPVIIGTMTTVAGALAIWYVMERGRR